MHEGKCSLQVARFEKSRHVNVEAGRSESSLAFPSPSSAWLTLFPATKHGTQVVLCLHGIQQSKEAK